MRRTAILGVTALLAALVFTAPAAGAPQKAFHWTVACEDGAFDVVAKGVPGWPLEGGPPVHLMGGHFYVTPDVGDPFDWVTDPPPGLMELGRLERCTVTGPLEQEVADFYLLVDPAWMFFPGS